MGIVLNAISFLGATLFALLLYSTILTGNWMAMSLAAIGRLVSLPVWGRSLVSRLGGWGVALRAFGGIVLLCATAYVILTYRPPSIY